MPGAAAGPQLNAIAPNSARMGGLAYLLLYAPYVMAESVAYSPRLSFAVAWTGSLAILYLTLSGAIKPLPLDRPLSAQMLRPVMLAHVVFAGYTALSSIFFFMNLHGFYYLTLTGTAAVDMDLLALTAAAQRYYVLAHAAFATGLLIAMDYRESSRWVLRTGVALPSFLLAVALAAFVGSVVVGQVPGLVQAAVRLQMLALVASVLSLAVSLPLRDVPLLLVNLGLYSVNLGRALLSGWKHDVMVVVVLLLVFTYQFYRRTALTLAPLAAIGLLVFLPSYNQHFRTLQWAGGLPAKEAAVLSYRTIVTGSTDLTANTWDFLTSRASEIGLFVEYLKHTPSTNDFAGTRIFQQAVVMLAPRVLWPDKPNVESLVMERAYANRVVSRGSPVSAKPQYVVDGYLSGGALGVFLACLLYGLLASMASRLAERWFGGYLLGSGLVFMSLFNIMWRGNSFEFFFSSVLLSFALMYALFVAGRFLGWLVPVGPVPAVVRPRFVTIVPQAQRRRVVPYGFHR